MSVFTVFALCFAAIVGLAIGSFLNVVIYRLPARIALTRPSACPSCEAPVRAWQNVPVVSWLALRGRCSTCRIAISPRYPLVEVATALAFVGVVWAATDAAARGAGPVSIGQLVTEQASGGPVLLAYLWFAGVSVALALIDLDTHRLPNAIVLPSYVVAIGLFGIATLLGAEPTKLARALIGAAALFAFYFVLRLVRPDGMGGGDVKLAGLVGIYLGWVGWGALVVGAFAAFVLGGLYGIALILGRRAGRRQAIPFGPWILAGTWLGLIAGEALARLYVQLVIAS